jgi:hypothetical protein
MQEAIRWPEACGAVATDGTNDDSGLFTGGGRREVRAELG